jgi:sugar (pentulose or hexulose) kinase
LGEACLRERVLDSLHQRGELHVARDEPVSAVGKVWFELQQALDSGGGLVSPIVGDQCHRFHERTPRRVEHPIAAGGERAPIEDRYARAAIFNLSLENSRADIIRAVLEGVALNTRWLLAPFEKFLGRRADTIHVVGGGANSDVWCQIFADVLSRRIRQMKDPIQANVRGVAFIGAIGLGRLDFDGIPARVECAREYEPNGGHRQTYDTAFEALTDLYRANKGIYRRLNRGHGH